MSVLAYGVAAWLLFVGLWGLVQSRNLVHMVICLAIVQAATYVLLVAIGYRYGAVAPVFAGIRLGTVAVDPVVQALCLTDFVVGAVALPVMILLALAKIRGGVQ